MWHILNLWSSFASKPDRLSFICFQKQTSNQVLKTSFQPVIDLYLSYFWPAARHVLSESTAFWLHCLRCWLYSLELWQICTSDLRTWVSPWFDPPLLTGSRISRNQSIRKKCIIHHIYSVIASSQFEPRLYSGSVVVKVDNMIIPSSSCGSYYINRLGRFCLASHRPRSAST